MRRLAKFIKALDLGGVTEQDLQGWIPVESSMLAKVRFTDRLEVEFTNGSIYAYASVPYELFEAMLEADSVGRFLNTHIKGVFAYKQVEPAWTAAV